MKIARWIGLAALAVSAPAAAQVTLNASSWVPPAHLVTADILMPLCADMQKVTSGRVKCNLLPKAVAAPPQTFDAIRDGLADISFLSHGYTPGRFLLNAAVEFPFTGGTAEASSVAYQRVYEKMLARAEEHNGVVVLSMMTHGPAAIYNTKHPIAALKDMQGMKIRVGSAPVGDIIRALGAVPMLKPINEIYELLSSGVADGVVMPMETPLAYKLMSLVKHVTVVPGGLYSQSMAWIANPAKWNSISEADRKLIQPLLGEALARRAGRAWDAADEKGYAALKTANIPMVMASPALIAEIKEKTASLEKEWIEKGAKPRGLDGAAVLKAFRAESAALSKK